MNQSREVGQHEVCKPLACFMFHSAPAFLKMACHKSSVLFRDHRMVTASWKDSRLNQLREASGLKVGS